MKKILTNGCVFYTVILTAFYTLGLLAEDGVQWIPTLRIAYSLLIFSLCFSALNEGVKRLPVSFPGKVFSHLAASAILYYLVFVLGGGFHKNGGSTLAAMLIFAAVYAIGFLFFAVFRWLFGSKKREKEAKEYKSIFQK